MNNTPYRGRRAVLLENGELQIIVTAEGGHIAAVVDKRTGVNPLWSPPWPTIEPSQYQRSKHPEYGDDSESKLLAGILGHNLCLDTFGTPSAAEAAAGMTVHGEASVAPYNVSVRGDTLTQTAVLAQAQLRFSRAIHLARGQRVAEITETVETSPRWIDRSPGPNTRRSARLSWKRAARNFASRRPNPKSWRTILPAGKAT